MDGLTGAWTDRRADGRALWRTAHPHSAERAGRALGGEGPQVAGPALRDTPTAARGTRPSGAPVAAAAVAWEPGRAGCRLSQLQEAGSGRRPSETLSPRSAPQTLRRRRGLTWAPDASSGAPDRVTAGAGLGPGGRVRPPQGAELRGRPEGPEGTPPNLGETDRARGSRRPPAGVALTEGVGGGGVCNRGGARGTEAGRGAWGGARAEPGAGRGRSRGGAQTVLWAGLGCGEGRRKEGGGNAPQLLPQIWQFRYDSRLGSGKAAAARGAGMGGPAT